MSVTYVYNDVNLEAFQGAVPGSLISEIKAL